MNNTLYDIRQCPEMLPSKAIVQQVQDNILKFITNYVPLSEDEVHVLNNQHSIIFCKKNTLLVCEGDFVKECFFVIKGCLRNYYLIDGEEKTTEFYTESQAIVPISYVKKQPSEYYLSCVEDCILTLASADRSKALIEKIPKLESLILQMNSELLVQNQISSDNFKNLNPEMRYLKFLKTRPDLFNRVPQYLLASYLGITPESLSRIRKRITKSSGRIN